MAENSKSVAGDVLAVFRHESRLYLFSPLTYIFLAGFLAALAAGMFLVADFYATDEASIRAMLVFLPWVAMIMVPALAMRAWVDEHSDRGIELMLTLPHRLSAVVAGKFLAGYALLLISLAFTAPMVASVYYLGAPDAGVLAAGYLAAALLIGLYFAVSLLASALAREPVGAFVIALLLLFVMLLMGWNVFSRLLEGWVAAPVIAVLAVYSPKTWLDSISRGFVDFAGVAYFLLVILTALWGTTLVINARRRGTSSLACTLKGLAVTLALLAALAVVIPAMSRVPLAFDLTAEGEFTLHQGTLRVVERLPDGVHVTLYWSAGEASVPVAIKSHARRVGDMFAGLAEKSQGKLTFAAVDPQPDSDEELEALAGGLRRVPMSSGDSFFFGAVFHHGGRVGNIPYFDIRRDRLAEYDIAVALNGFGAAQIPKIGVVSPLLPSIAAIENQEGLSFMAELKRAYDIAVIPHFREALPEGLDVVIVLDATILRREMLYAIDQFIMAGGNLILMIDPYVRFHRASNQVNPQPSKEINDISDLLLVYGIRYLGGDVVGDVTLAAPVADRRQVKMSFPFWMRLRQEQLSASHPVTAALNEVFFVEAGALSLEAGNRAQALVTTTEKSGSRQRQGFNEKTPRQLALDFKPDGRRRVIAAALRGPFESAFKKPPREIGETKHLRRSEDGPVIFAIADVDWLFDPFALQSMEVGGQLVVRPLNDNLALLLNLVEYASGDPALISIRSRGRLQRPFTRVVKLFQAAEERYREQEAGLARQIAEIEKRVQVLAGQEGIDNYDQLPAEVKSEVRKVQQKLLPMRKKLRDIRHRIREEVDSLGRHLIVINLLAGPFFVLLFAAFVHLVRRKRKPALLE